MKRSVIPIIPTSTGTTTVVVCFTVPRSSLTRFNIYLSRCWFVLEFDLCNYNEFTYNLFVMTMINSDSSRILLQSIQIFSYERLEYSRIMKYILSYFTRYVLDLLIDCYIVVFLFSFDTRTRLYLYI